MSEVALLVYHIQEMATGRGGGGDGGGGQKSIQNKNRKRNRNENQNRTGLGRNLRKSGPQIGLSGKKKKVNYITWKVTLF